MRQGHSGVDASSRPVAAEGFVWAIAALSRSTGWHEPETVVLYQSRLPGLADQGKRGQVVGRGMGAQVLAHGIEHTGGDNVCVIDGYAGEVFLDPLQSKFLLAD
jgi:hypothetical protein